jgi:EmrB/QacA subfamily drug resistance transporter
LPAVRATPANKWWILIAISMALFMSATNGTTMNLALPTLLRTFESTFAAVQWVVLAYLVCMAVLLPSIGRWGDLVGRRRVFMQGQLLFILGTLLCAGAMDIPWLIGFRILQAVGSAMMMGIGIAIITETWPTSQRGTALGIASGCIASGAIAGPLIGGFLLEALNWRWLFLFNVPIGLFSLVVVWRVVPSLAPGNRGERFDIAGAVAIGGALLGFSLALTLGQELGYRSLWIQGLLAAALLFTLGFVWIERRVAHPMIDLRLFRDMAFAVNLLSALVIFSAVSGVMVIVPFYLEFVQGMSQRMMGILLAVLPLAYVSSTPISGILSDRIGTRPMIGCGLGLTALGMGLVAQLQVDSSLWQFVLYLLPIGIGMGAFNTPNTSAVMGSVPRAQLGVASSLLSETRTLGQAAGVAVLGSFFALRLQHYAGPTSTVNSASAHQIVQALRDDFLIAALLVILCLAGVLWAWRSSTETVVLEAAD